MTNEQNPKRSEDDIWQEAFESGDYTQASKPTPTDAIEDEQQDYLLDISRFAVNNQYKSESLKNETARYFKLLLTA